MPVWPIRLTPSSSQYCKFSTKLCTKNYTSNTKLAVISRAIFKFNAEIYLRLKSNGTCNSIERAILSNAPNSIEPATVATKKIGRKPV